MEMATCISSPTVVTSVSLLLGSARRRDLFLTVLEQVRQRYQFVVLGYVVMPEHFHLLISEPQERSPSTVMQALKLGFARRVLFQMRRRRNAAQLVYDAGEVGHPPVRFSSPSEQYSDPVVRTNIPCIDNSREFRVVQSAPESYPAMEN